MKLFISAGDPSGDFVGSFLVQKLREQKKEIEFLAVGGEKLESAGAHLLENSSDWSAIGIFDALTKVPKVYQAYSRLKKKLKSISLDGAIYIDCPTINIPISKLISKRKIPSVYLFPPSAWKNDLQRAREVGNYVDEVIVPFQQAAKLYEQAGVPTYFSGHPLLDLIPADKKSTDFFRKFNLDEKRPLLGIFPGSRDQEIKYLLKLQIDVACQLHEKFPSLQFALAIAQKNLKEQIQKEMNASKLRIVAACGINYDLMKAATLLLLTSGTATLEAALFEKPMVIVYKVSPWTWRLEKPFTKGVKFAGLPNLLAGKKIVPELLQDKATQENIANELTRLFTQAQVRETMIENLRLVRQQLGSPGVMERVACRILEKFHG